MSRFFIVAWLTLGIDAYAQCKYAKNETDDFTGSRTTVTQPVTFARYKLWNLKMYVFRSDSVYYLRLYFPTDKDFDLGCLTDRSYVSLKFANGEVLTLRNRAAISCDDTKAMLLYLDNREHLKKNQIVKVRYSLERSLDLNVIDPESVSKAITCAELGM